MDFYLHARTANGTIVRQPLAAATIEDAVARARALMPGCLRCIEAPDGTRAWLDEEGRTMSVIQPGKWPHADEDE